MKKFLKVTADTNDADYVTKFTEISEADLVIILPLIRAIKDFKPYKVKKKDNMGGYEWTHSHNFPDSQYRREDLGEQSVYEIYEDVGEKVIDIFTQKYCPYGENGIHTIESISLYEVVNEEILL